nr:YajQ family cyclic di-GMP-binding protein [uncultured Moellerella sp.]
MPSFDIVSEVDLQEVRNAVENAQRELTSRWDFRNINASIELNEKNETINLASESDFQVNQLVDILREKMAKRNIDGSVLNIPDQMVHSGKTFSVDATLKQGIDAPQAKKIVKLIKDSKIKVQAQIQGEQVRVTGKARDDLQAVMALIRQTDLGQPFQFENFRD